MDNDNGKLFAFVIENHHLTIPPLTPPKLKTPREATVYHVE